MRRWCLPAIEPYDQKSMAQQGKRKKNRREHRKNVAAARTGKKHSEETKAKIAFTKKLTASMTPHERLLHHQHRSGTHARYRRVATAQWHLDLEKCIEIGDRELYEDVRRSHGWKKFRKKFDPESRVSDGFGLINGTNLSRVWWGPKRIEESQ